MDFAQQKRSYQMLAKAGGATGDRFIHAVPLHNETFTNPPVADVDYFVTTTSTAASIVVHSPAVADLDPPRPLTFVASNHADFNAVAMVIVGTIRAPTGTGTIAATETLTLTDGGNTTDTSLTCWVNVTSITIPAQASTGGSYTIGFGAGFGLQLKAKERAGCLAIHSEIGANAIVATAGAFSTIANGLPHGKYTPATAADGTRDYALCYEVDMT